MSYLNDNVKRMYFTEWYAARELELFKAEERAAARAEGYAEGYAEVIQEENERIASDMLRENLPLPLIAKISKLQTSDILSIAKSLGVSVIDS